MSKRGKSIKIEKPCPYEKMMKPLVGGIITHVVVDKESDHLGDVFCGLIVKKGSKTFEVVAYQDDECNGPGAFHIAEVK